MATLAIVLLVLWLLSFTVFKVTSAAIHLLLIIAAVLFIYRMVTGRRGPTAVP
jgi:hypothetical protein